MKISSINLTQFKRFTHLEVCDLPATAKLVVVLGPNGSGKSSLFEAFNVYLDRTKGSSTFESSYHPKFTSPRADTDTQPVIANWTQLIHGINIKFHDAPIYDPMNPDPSYLKAFYIRSGYRNEADFSMTSLSRRGDMLLDENRPKLLISPDSRVSDNYTRIVSTAVSDLFGDTVKDSTTKADLRDRLIGEIQESVARVMPGLHLQGIGDPLMEGTFLFNKGISNGWRYKNLSGGEKAAFDLILDFVVKKEKFDNTVFCIDEPEIHMNTAVQAALLNELYSKVSDKSQLWITTHSVGMMRAAQDLSKDHPGSVVFLDFADVDFDKSVEMRPAVTDRAFWKKTFAVAIGDLADLVAPNHLVFCEGDRNGRKNPKFDARCYAVIFAKEFPEVEFVSLGGGNEVETNALLITSVLKDVLTGTQFSKVVDLDDRGPDEIQQLGDQKVRVLSKRDIENFLFSDEILRRLCELHSQSEKLNDILEKKAQLILASAARSNPADDVKSISGELYNYLKKQLSLTQCGNNSEAFCITTLSPLVTPETMVYSELKRDIFGQ